MSVMESSGARTQRSFTDEFKRDAVAMVLDDGNKIVDVAVSASVKARRGTGCAKPASPGASAPGGSTAERVDLVELRRENALMVAQTRPSWSRRCDEFSAHRESHDLGLRGTKSRACEDPSSACGAARQSV